MNARIDASNESANSEKRPGRLPISPVLLWVLLAEAIVGSLVVALEPEASLYLLGQLIARLRFGLLEFEILLVCMAAAALGAVAVRGDRVDLTRWFARSGYANGSQGSDTSVA